MMIQSGGCKRNWEADCGDGEVFLMFEGIKLPDKGELTCEFECSKYSSCLAYMKHYTVAREIIYIRMA